MNSGNHWQTLIKYPETCVTDNSGNPLENYEYDAQGQFQITNGSGTVKSTTQIANDLLYTGRNYDYETGNYFYRARYYNPQLGRFISRDPLSGAEFSQGTNLYAYCGNNFLNASDPTGQFINFLVGGAIGGLVDIGAQLIRNGGDLGNLNYGELGVATLAGAASSGISALAEGATASVGSSALAGAATNVAVNVAGNAAVGTTAQMANNALNGQPLTNDLVTAAILGGGFGALGSTSEQII